MRRHFSWIRLGFVLVSLECAGCGGAASANDGAPTNRDGGADETEIGADAVAQPDGDDPADGISPACRDPLRPADKYFPNMTKLGERGLLSFQLVESRPAPPSMGSNVLTLRVTRSDGGPVSGGLEATRTIAQSPVPVDPVVTFDPTTSLYTIDPVILFLAGVWRIELKAYDGPAGSGNVTDLVTFFFCIED